MQVDKVIFNRFIYNGVEHKSIFEVGKLYPRTLNGATVESECLQIYAYYESAYKLPSVAHIHFDNNKILEIGNINQIIRSNVENEGADKTED